MITQTPSLKILQTQIGGINWGNCGKTVEPGLPNLPGITEINLVFATESFGIN
jgi:Cd2+/Zn2+-exporting ATPase